MNASRTLYNFVARVQISYLVLLGLYSYFMTVELSPRQPTACEYIVWVWSGTMWLEEFRQVDLRHCGLHSFTIRL